MWFDSQKLGFSVTSTEDEHEDSKREEKQPERIVNQRKVIDNLVSTMAKTGADWTNTFRMLSQVDPDSKSADSDGVLAYMMSQCDDLEQLLKVGSDVDCCRLL